MLFYQNFQEYLQQETQRLEILKRTPLPHQGIISQTLLSTESVNSASSPSSFSYLITHPVNHLYLDGQGIIGDRHRCISRPSGGREKQLYPRGTEIIQRRHLLIVSQADCQALSDRIGVEITPQLLGANLVIDDVNGHAFSMSMIPTGTHLVFTDPNLGSSSRPPLATLIAYVQQRGCGQTGKVIADHYQDQSLVKRFRDESRENRGMIFCVEYPVKHSVPLSVGQTVEFYYASGISP